MERRFELRKAELLADCQVHPAVFAGMMERLDQFAEPFAARLRRPEQRAHTRMYLQGLLSDVERKNAEAIAYRHDEDRQGLQTFLGTAPWDYQPLLEELACQVGTELGEPDGVIVFDPSAFPKKGRHSVGRRAAVVRTIGKGRQLPSGNLHGLRLAERTRAGGCAVVCSAGMDEGSSPPQGMRDSQGTSLSDSP